MRQAILVLKGAKIPSGLEGDFYGADHGALEIVRQGYELSGAIGDFDSVTPDEKELIKSKAKQLHELNPMKDYSDTCMALKMLKSLGYSRIVVVGGLQKRFDHTWANVQLLRKHEDIIWLDEFNKLQILQPGEHTVSKSGYKYISFFALSNGYVSLSKFVYNLTDYEINELDSLCLSNEIVLEEGIVKTDIKLLCIQSND